MTRKELRERNNGHDPFVVVMPLICSACGHVWDAPLSAGKCYLVAALSGAASLLCSVAFLACLGTLVWAVFIRAEKAEGGRLAPILTGAVVSLGGAIATAVACCKYIRRARER
jgi:hypothetical protein